MPHCKKVSRAAGCGLGKDSKKDCVSEICECKEI